MFYRVQSVAVPLVDGCWCACEGVRVRGSKGLPSPLRLCAVAAVHVRQEDGQNPEEGAAFRQRR